MTIGFDAIGLHAIGEMITSSSTPLVYEPVSRIIAGGFSSGRPAQVATLTIIDYILWDDGDFMFWDDDTPIAFD